MPEWKKPLPTVSGETRAFWDLCRQGQLLIQKCERCGEYQFYPRVTGGGRLNGSREEGKEVATGNEVRNLSSYWVSGDATLRAVVSL